MKRYHGSQNCFKAGRGRAGKSAVDLHINGATQVDIANYWKIPRLQFVPSLRMDTHLGIQSTMKGKISGKN